MESSFLSPSASKPKSISVYSAPNRAAVSLCPSELSFTSAHISAAARLPLSTVETYFGCSGRMVSTEYQL